MRPIRRYILYRSFVQSTWNPISDETRKRITILPEKLSDDAKMILKRLFDPNLTEVDAKAANTMLVASSPKDSATARAAFIRNQQQHLSVTAVTATRKPVQRDKQVCKEVIFSFLTLGFKFQPFLSLVSL